jgi:hypothetical protein
MVQRLVGCPKQYGFRVMSLEKSVILIKCVFIRDKCSCNKKGQFPLNSSEIWECLFRHTFVLQQVETRCGVCINEWPSDWLRNYLLCDEFCVNYGSHILEVGCWTYGYDSHVTARYTLFRRIMKLNLYTKLHRGISYNFHLMLYSTPRASPVTAQRPSHGAFSHKKPPSARSLWPVFHLQFHLPYFLEEPGSANLQSLRRPRTLSKYFSARERNLVWKCWPSLLEYCLYIIAKTEVCSHKL